MNLTANECDIVLVEPTGGSIPSRALVPSESRIRLCVDGCDLYRVMCTPSEIKELVYGRLLTEGMVSDKDEIESVNISEDLSVAYVKTHEAEDAPHDTLASAKGHGRISCNTVGCYDIDRPIIPIASPQPAIWTYEKVFEMARGFASDTPMHIATSGAHSCTLLNADGRSVCCEDIGRHNALDKAVGSAMLAGFDLSSSLVFSSGRIPADMVCKVIRARIPILVSKGVPTDLGVEIARDMNLMLICAARPDSLKVFNDSGAMN